MSFVDGTGSDTAGHTGGTRVETSTVMMSTKHTQGKEKKREKKRWRCYTCSLLYGTVKLGLWLAKRGWGCALTVGGVAFYCAHIHTHCRQ